MLHIPGGWPNRRRTESWEHEILRFDGQGDALTPWSLLLLLSNRPCPPNVPFLLLGLYHAIWLSDGLSLLRGSKRQLLFELESQNSLALLNGFFS